VTIAVTVEGDAEVAAVLDDRARKQRQVGRAAAIVDVGTVRRIRDRNHLGAKPSEGFGRDRGIGAVGAIDRQLEPAQVGAKALEDVLEVAVGRHLDVIDRAAAGGLGVHQRLDLELDSVGELAPVVVEELDPVVLRRIVRGGDDHAEIKREQGHGRCRQYPAEHGHSARLDDAARKGRFELESGCPGVATDEDAAARRPDSRGPRQLLDQLDGEIFADDATHTVCAEVPSRSSYLDLRLSCHRNRVSPFAPRARASPRALSSLGVGAPF
jgi:hypothetical protein